MYIDMLSIIYFNTIFVFLKYDYFNMSDRAFHITAYCSLLKR